MPDKDLEYRKISGLTASDGSLHKLCGIHLMREIFVTMLQKGDILSMAFFRKIATGIRVKIIGEFPFLNELYYHVRSKKLFRKEYERLFKPKFDELIKKGDDAQRAFAFEMNKKAECCAFAGEWTRKYKRNARILTDKRNSMNYVLYKTRLHGEKRLYFKKGWNKVICSEYIRYILMEQDHHSPHFYFTNKVINALKNGGTVLDLGVAEGNFSLEFIDDADRVYLFEPDSSWYKPLKKTFADYRHKIVLCKKFVSDKSGENCVSVDEFFGDSIPTDIKLIKMDIEGFEQKALIGMKKTLEKNPDAILLICIYHTQYVENEIRDILSAFREYDIKVRKGFMFFSDDPNLAFPYLRHGVIECKAKR